MSHVIWYLLLFHSSRLFIGFYYMQQWLNVSNTGEKLTILIPKVFLRLLNSFEAIFRQETSTSLQWKSRFTFSFQKCIMSREFCHSFVNRKVGLRIISFRCPFRLLVWNFGRQGLIVGASGDRVPVRQQPCHCKI